MYVQNRRIVASRRGWLKQFGITVGALSVGLTSTTERAEAIGVGGELVAMSLMNPEVRKSIGRYKKGLLGGASTLLSIGVLGLKKLDEITDTILGAELGQISEKAAKQREIVDGGHWKYSSRLLPYANNLMLPSQSIVGEFNLRFKEFLAPVPKGKGGAGFDATFSDYNQQELLYSLTVEPRENLSKLHERPIFPNGRRLQVASKDRDAVGALAKSLLNNVKSDDLKKLVAKEYQLAYVRPMFAGGAEVNGIGFNHNSNDPTKHIFWVVDYSSYEALSRTVLLDRLLGTALS